MSSTGMRPLLLSIIFVSMLVQTICTSDTEKSSLLEHGNGSSNAIISTLQHMASSIRNQEVYQNQTTMILSQLANTQSQMVNAQAEMASVLNKVVRILQDMNGCFSRPCQNQGQCVNGDNGYTCECQAGWTGVNCEKDVDECTSAPCQNGGLCIDGVNNYTCQCIGGWTGLFCDTACFEYLGMENGDIPGGNIQASTYVNYNHPLYARLNGEDYWMANMLKSNLWIQADIGYQTYVSGVATQGSSTKYNRNTWVTSFKVSTFNMTTSNPEIYIRDSEKSIKVFKGNTNGDSIVTSTFPEPVFARIVRITCLENGPSSSDYLAMRFEILGCKSDDLQEP